MSKTISTDLLVKWIEESWHKCWDDVNVVVKVVPRAELLAFITANEVEDKLQDMRGAGIPADKDTK